MLAGRILRHRRHAPRALGLRQVLFHRRDHPGTGQHGGDGAIVQFAPPFVGPSGGGRIDELVVQHLLPHGGELLDVLAIHIDADGGTVHAEWRGASLPEHRSDETAIARIVGDMRVAGKVGDLLGRCAILIPCGGGGADAGLAENVLVVEHHHRAGRDGQTVRRTAYGDIALGRRGEIALDIVPAIIVHIAQLVGNGELMHGVEVQIHQIGNAAPRAERIGQLHVFVFIGAHVGYLDFDVRV